MGVKGTIAKQVLAKSTMLEGMANQHGAYRISVPSDLSRMGSVSGGQRGTRTPDILLVRQAL